MNNILYFACVYTLVSVISAASIPPLTKCKAEDSKCMKKSAQDLTPVFAEGLPNLGVASMNPIHLKSVDASSPNLKLIIDDLYVYGLKDCIVKKIQRDVAKSKISLKFLCTTKMEGNYEMKGQILILPMEGKGKMHSSSPKMLVSIDADVGEIEKNGVKFWTIKTWKSVFELKERSSLEFENLFNGNELLSRTSTELIRSSANEIITEIGAPIVNAIVGKVVENISHFFNKVPISELTLDV